MRCFSPHHVPAGSRFRARVWSMPCSMFECDLAVSESRWGTIMSGVEDEVGRVVIPSVFVSHSTGLTLKNASQQAGGQEGEEVGVVLVTLNDTGHVKPKTKRIGPIETLATYVVVSLVLLSFSGCCGLLLALCVTCYQRAFRVRALRNLKTQTFKRPPNAAKRWTPTILLHLHLSPLSPCLLSR